MYKITIIEATGFCTSKEQDTRDGLEELQAAALKRAQACLPWAQYPNEMRHMVYYYEYPFNGNIEVRIEMNPRLVSDDVFYNFVEKWKPLYVGAFHRL